MLLHVYPFFNFIFLGHGLFEINMVKAMFKPLWEIILQDLAKILGFRSPKALAACQSANGIEEKPNKN